ncbi:MAG: chitinase [Planctomycetota bacterium]|jgi:chitinase
MKTATTLSTKQLNLRKDRDRAGRVTQLTCFMFLLLTAVVRGQDVPDRILVGYWHNWTFSPNNLTLTQLPSEYDVINVSFAIPQPVFGSTMTFNPDANLYPNPATFISDVATLQAQGKKVLISIGGANGPVHLNNTTEINNFVTSMLSIINTYGFDGLDIDLEGGSLSIGPGDNDFTNPTSPRVVNFISAIHQLLALLPSDFLLTAAPETATVQGALSAYAGVWGSYLAVLDALRNDLDWVQVQHYNTGSMLGRDGNIYNPATADFHVAMADMLITGFFVPAAGKTFAPLEPRQIVIGLPSSTSAAGSGFTSNAIVHQALDHLYLGQTGSSSYQLGDQNGYPDFRGVMTWSINWDVNAGGIFSTGHRAYLDGVNLKSDTKLVTYSAGATVNFDLRAGVEHAGRTYYLVPTISGTSPGTWLSSNRTFPINLDFFSDWPFEFATQSFFPGFIGILDGDGEATATMNVPATPGQPPYVTHYAFILSYPWEFYSPAVRIDFIP